MNLIEKIEKGIYVCPKPIKWNSFALWLEAETGDSDYPVPLLLTGWHFSNSYFKNQRLKEQIDFAKKYNLEPDALDYLNAIPEEDWLTSNGNLNPDVVTPAVQWELDWSDAKKAVYQEAKPIIDQFEEMLGDRDDDLIYELFQEAGVYDRLDIGEAKILINASSIPEEQSRLLCELYELYYKQMDGVHGDDSIDGYLLDITDEMHS